MSTPARWDLTNVYPSLESPEFEAAFADLRCQLDEQERLFRESLAVSGADTPVPQLARLGGEALRRFNGIHERVTTLRSYVMSFVSTDSHNTLAMKKMSEFQKTFVRVQNLTSQFRAWVGRIEAQLDAVTAADPICAAHAFSLRETAEQSRYLMTEAEEALAAELNLSGTNAWSRLQGVVTSQLTVDFELDGRQERLPMPALINLHSHPEEAVRRRAHEAELRAWESVREPLAACMNGVKGTAVTINRHRGRRDSLHQAVDLARIDPDTLETMLAAIQDALPVFRRYFHAKALRLGKDRLAWWDLFAPTGRSEKLFSYDEAREFITENFARFTPELSDFARRAFDGHWIDAEPREGKRGGAFCMGLPAVRESRVLCNFDGTLDQVSTIAHELGHAFHNHCAYQAGRTELQKETPMTLAETASIMNETIVMQAVLAETGDPLEQLAILETQLIGDAQVIVDVYSRYLFEKEVFSRREVSDLSADELCEIMTASQRTAYGDGLDERYLHPYMWTWKPHYYYGGLPFYNFPYSFGLLFGIGLYALYEQRGADFVPDYKDLLASTGQARAADLAARFGIDLRARSFWDASLGVIARRVDRYCAL